jgi:hypothetical protein
MPTEIWVELEIMQGVAMAKVIKKTRTRRLWTKEDIRELKALARQKVSADRIAKKFKRTVPALRQKAMNLGISLDTRAARGRKA